MKNPVIIKGDKGGIHIIIEPLADMKEVLFQLEFKLKGNHSRFRNSKPINVAFEGKELTDDEKKDILFVLNNIGLNVCHNTKKLEKKSNIESNIQPEKDGLFYIGDLKKGLSINAKYSIVIVGNVEKGASVYSKGNIVITGALDGIAKAGYSGKEDAFVYSLISGRNI